MNNIPNINPCGLRSCQAQNTWTGGKAVCVRKVGTKKYFTWRYEYFTDDNMNVLGVGAFDKPSQEILFCTA